MHFCAEEAMALVALLTGAWHFWVCRCVDIREGINRLTCKLFGHGKLHKKMDLQIDEWLCGRCWKVVKL